MTNTHNTHAHTDIQFSQRFNANIDRPVYYAKSNTLDEYTMLDILCKKFGVREWEMGVYPSTTHEYAIKVIDTALGIPLDTCARW
jgi:hypothetical protein